jgi:hypothetical protein
MVPPGGGPQDRQGPSVVAYAPDSGEVRVGLLRPVVLGFSEKMNRSSVRDWLLMAPWPGKMECNWERDTLTCRPVDGWREETTYTVLLGKGAVDRQRNGLAEPLLFAFSTGESLADGRIRGHVRTRSLKREAAMLYLFPWPVEARGPLPPEAALRPNPQIALRLAQSGAEGEFEIPFVPRGEEFLLGALFDASGNRAYDEGRDLWGFAEFPVVCPDTVPGVAEVELYLVYADESGDLCGEIVDTTCSGYIAPQALRAQADSVRRVLEGEVDAMGFAVEGRDSLPEARLTEAERDSLTADLQVLAGRLATALEESLRCGGTIWISAFPEGDSVAVAQLRTTAAFEIKDLPPGFYRLEGFRDLNGNGSPDAEEPAGKFPFPVEVKPGRVVEELRWEISAGALEETPGAMPEPGETE